MGPPRWVAPLAAWTYGIVALLVALVVLPPFLIEELRIRELRSAAPDAPVTTLLFQSGTTRALRALMDKAVHDPRCSMDHWQRRAFLRHPGRFRRTLPVLAAAVWDHDAETRLRAVSALRRPEWRTPEAAAVLLGTCSAEDRDVRLCSVVGLGQHGPVGAPAVNALVRAAADSDEEVRREACRALGKVGPVGPAGVLSLRGALSDPSARVASVAANSLSRLSALDPYVSAAAPELIEALAAGDGRRVHAAWALGCLGRDARAAFGPLLAAIESSEPWPSGWLDEFWDRNPAAYAIDPFARALAREALVRLAPDPAQAVPALRRLLRPAWYSHRDPIITALGAMGPTAAAAATEIVASLSDWPALSFSSRTNWVAVDALVRLGPAARPALLEALHPESPWSAVPRVRFGATVALGSLDDVPPEVAAAAAPLLVDLDRGVRFAAALLIRRADPTRDVVPVVLEASRGERAGPAGAILGRGWTHGVGAAGAPSIPRLLEAAEAGDETSSCAVALLGAIAIDRGDPEPVLPHIVRWLNGPSPRLRRDAAGVLLRLPGAACFAPSLLAAALHDGSGPASRAAVLFGMADVIRSLDDPGAFVGLALQALRSTQTEEQVGALRCLEAVGPRAASVAAELRRMVEGSDGGRRAGTMPPPSPRIAEAALSAVEPAPEDEPPHSDLRHRLAPLLEGKKAEAMITKQLLQQARRIRSDLLEDPERRLIAAGALLRAGDPPASSLPLVRDGLRDVTRGDDLPEDKATWRTRAFSPLPPTFPRRRDAARIAAAIGPAARDLLPDVEACARTRDPILIALAAEASWRIAGRPRIDDLLALVRETAAAPVLYFARQGPPCAGPGTLEALRVLSAMGPAAREAEAPLRRLLTEPRAPELRQAIEATIAAICPER